MFIYPPAHTRMKVTPEMERILHRARAPNQLSIFLEKEQLFGVDDVALVCTKEALLDETLIAPAKAAGVPCDSLAEKVCIKKVWALCREAFATGRPGRPASQTEQEDQALPDEVKRSLDGQWEACHGFVLNTFRLLSETQQNKIYRMSHGAPRAFPIVLLESMRLLCRLTDGKPVKAASSTRDSNVSEEVSGVFELWTRLRAFFTTLTYTSIDQKDWFGFGDCEQFVDQVFHWLHFRHSGLRAPIQFYIEAFNNSCATFQSAIRANRTLNSVIGNPSEYQHFWTVFVPNSKVDNTVKSRERKSWRGDQVPRITKLDTKKHFSMQETSSPIETVLLTSYESSPT